MKSLKRSETFSQQRRTLRRSSFAATVVVAIVCATSPNTSSAQTKRSPHKTAAVTAVKPAKVDCGGGVELRVSSASPAQGTLLVAEVRSAKTLSDITGKFTDRDISFWQATGANIPKGINVRRALLGVDLEQAAGDYKLNVTGKSADGAALACEAPIAVRIGKFPTERLKVAPNFVEPNPEQAAKAAEDQKKLRALYATVTPEKFWTGPFRIPLDGVKTGGNFGKRRVLNGKSNSPHSGVDLPSPTGTPVHAAQSGRVVLAEELYFAGNTVIIDHGFGIYTLYGHFSEIDAKVGDEVKVGDIIGKVGATGRVTGPHLHWGLEVDRARVNALEIVGKQ
ncbi:MAG TPA: M23 family metallopeptidase [Candidatus Eremiobacteraceae bacterium]|jgi:murein DD-endopeptidase MepM/ murein hydrolase activator NlpD|nr:M23 family metallopeptidase [Candidatus Eremiobacteraceae bacterium]